MATSITTQEPSSPSSQSNCDFLNEFGCKNSLGHIVTAILGYLPAKDLTSICCVNKAWKYVCENDPKSNRRRIHYLNELRDLKDQLGQENWPVKKGTIEQRTGTREAFNDFKNIIQQAGTGSPQNASCQNNQTTQSNQTINSQPIPRSQSTTVERSTNILKTKVLIEKDEKCSIHIVYKEHKSWVKHISSSSSSSVKSKRKLSVGSKISKKNLKRL